MPIEEDVTITQLEWERRNRRPVELVAYASEIEDRCRWCNQPIRWRKTGRGKNMPIDHLPIDPATLPVMLEPGERRRRLFAIDDRGCWPFDRQDGDDPAAPRYGSHWDSCPNAREVKASRAPRVRRDVQLGLPGTEGL